MTNFFSKELVDSCVFNWNELNGKTLEISVGSSVDSIAKRNYYCSHGARQNHR